MEGLMFLGANLITGAIIIWLILNDTRGDLGGTTGWFAFRKPKKQDPAGEVRPAPRPGTRVK